MRIVLQGLVGLLTILLIGAATIPAVAMSPVAAVMTDDCEEEEQAQLAPHQALQQMQTFTECEAAPCGDIRNAYLDEDLNGHRNGSEPQAHVSSSSSWPPLTWPANKAVEANLWENKKDAHGDWRGGYSNVFTHPNCGMEEH
jgi:hypothetical protein